MNREDSVLATTDVHRAVPRQYNRANDVRICDVPRRASECRVADVLVVGSIETVLTPVLDVLDGCGWTIRYQSRAASAAHWLTCNRALVAVVEVEGDWRDVVARLRHRERGPNVIVVTQEDLAAEDVFGAGAHDVLRLPVDSYNLLWSVVTAWHEARNEHGERWRFP